MNGITAEQFQSLFIQCQGCGACILRRYLEDHDCDKASVLHRRPSEDDQEQILYGLGGEGLPVKRFEAVFSRCYTCHNFFVSSTAKGHGCFFWD